VTNTIRGSDLVSKGIDASKAPCVAAVRLLGAVLSEGFYLPMGRQLLTAVAEELPKLPANVHKEVANQ
jgi:hypothetical protein